jgi:DMSO/TMAO reductase YedYZ heme-binding membrane subunit
VLNGHLWWYVARSGGIVAWVLVTASVLWGLALSTRALGKRPRPNWLLDLHRFLGGLAVVFTGIHVGGLVLDSYTHFGPVQVLMPFTSDYRASAVAWGIIGAYLLLAVEITSLMRTRLSKQVWRRVHLLSFPLFALSTVHGLLAGTDASNHVLRWAMLLATAGVVALTVLRIDQVTALPLAVPEPAQRRFASPPGGEAGRSGPSAQKSFDGVPPSHLVRLAPVTPKPPTAPMKAVK